MQSNARIEKVIRQSEFRFMDKEKHSRIRKESRKLMRQKRAVIRQLKHTF